MIWHALFGWPGSWGTAGNLVAWVVCGIPVHAASAWQHRRVLHRRLDQLEARLSRRPEA